MLMDYSRSYSTHCVVFSSTPSIISFASSCGHTVVTNTRWGLSHRFIVVATHLVFLSFDLFSRSRDSYSTVCISATLAVTSSFLLLFSTCWKPFHMLVRPSLLLSCLLMGVTCSMKWRWRVATPTKRSLSEIRRSLRWIRSCRASMKLERRDTSTLL